MRNFCYGIYYVDLPQVDLTRIPGKMFWRAKCDFFGREADERATKSREVPRAIKMRRRTFRKSTLRLVSKERLRGTRKWPFNPHAVWSPRIEQITSVENGF